MMSIKIIRSVYYAYPQVYYYANKNDNDFARVVSTTHYTHTYIYIRFYKVFFYGRLKTEFMFIKIIGMFWFNEVAIVPMVGLTIFGFVNATR